MTDVDITLREAVPTDASILLDAIKQLNTETPFLLVSQQALNMSSDTMAHEIDYLFNAPGHMVLLAFDKETIIGVATITSEPDRPLQHIGEVGISVNKHYWGLGLGTLMLEELVTWAESTNLIKRLEIKVQKRNTRAISLYEKVGFELEGTIRRGFLSENNDFLDVLLLSKLL
ncbi:MAG: GNAT family N-acetyltransferase [Vagococcus sp.]